MRVVAEDTATECDRAQVPAAAAVCLTIGNSSSIRRDHVEAGAFVAEPRHLPSRAHQVNRLAQGNAPAVMLK